jgi:hypothetical protein
MILQVAECQRDLVHQPGHFQRPACAEPAVSHTPPLVCHHSTSFFCAGLCTTTRSGRCATELLPSCATCRRCQSPFPSLPLASLVHSEPFLQAPGAQPFRLRLPPAVAGRLSAAQPRRDFRGALRRPQKTAAPSPRDYASGQNEVSVVPFSRYKDK